MWPPSSGSSGTKLNMPMKKLKLAMRKSSVTSFSVIGKASLAAASPAKRPPPTIETGLSGSRSWSPTIARPTS